MTFDEYQAEVRKAAALVESKNHQAALDILQKLASRPLPDLDKTVMLVNLATVCDKLQRSELALEAYDKAVALEQPHHRFFALEAKAAYLAQKKRFAESLELYQLLSRHTALTWAEQERIKQNIAYLEKKS